MIVLMTDFSESEYAGMMKGVIYTIYPKARVVDLTHEISPQSVREGAWILLQGYPYFPKKTTFVCVVDPGVGTGRDAVLVRTKNYVFIGPDNGLMYPSAHKDGIKEIFKIQIDQPEFTTFHGREIFAKVAAYVASGAGEKFLGERKSDLDIVLRFWQEGRSGEVVRVDHFGNIITNLPPLDKDMYHLNYRALNRDITWADTYGKGPEYDMFLVTGSAGTLELSVKNGRAADRLPARVGDTIVIK